MQEMEKQEHEEEDPRNPLEHVKPVSTVTVLRNVVPSFPCDKQTVNGVVGERKKDSEDLDQQKKRQMMNIGDRIIKNLGAVHRLRVGEHMNREKDPQRHDACDLVKFPQYEFGA